MLRFDCKVSAEIQEASFSASLRKNAKTFDHPNEAKILYQKLLNSIVLFIINLNWKFIFSRRIQG